MGICSGCGEENAERARFCQGCGAPLLAATPVHESRKIVTILFCDVVGSTAMGERLDPESLRRIMDRYFEAMRAPIERHGGTLEKFIGDAVMAVFGIPTIHEDDALRAVRAAAEMREALTGLNKSLLRDFGTELANRIGIMTGEVVTGDPLFGDRIVTGDPVNTAARLEQAAGRNEILLGVATFRMVRDAVDVEAVESIGAKGKAEPIDARRLLRVAPDAVGIARHLDSPLVGRARELKLLEQAFERAVTDRTCQLLTVLGPAGIGKSRLVEEFLGSRDTSTVILRGRCLPYGDAITYWPIVEIVVAAADLTLIDPPGDTRVKLRRLFGDRSDGDILTERLAQLVGVAGAVALPDETFWAVRKLLESVAVRTPLIVDLDDLHWAEPTLLDLIEHVADWSRDVPILLVCSARPELLDGRPGWAGGKLNAASFLLEPLGAGDTERLVGDILGGSNLPQELLDRIASAAEGNPLFAEQSVAMLVDDGSIALAEAGWIATREVDAIPVPPTIHALIDARLDSLATPEAVVLERASIEGKVFHRGGLLAVLADEARVDADRHLASLVRRDLIRSEPSTLEGEDAFRFRHLLIRDSAYERMPKETRADLHEGFAVWLGTTAGNRTLDLDEIVGYHLERSALLRKELGSLDDRARAVAGHAGDLLTEAGDRAADRGDHGAAGDLWARAFALLPEDEARTYARLGSIRAAYFISARHHEVEAILASAVERADHADAPVQAGFARAMLAFARTFWDPLATATEALEMITISELSLTNPEDRRMRAWCRYAAAVCYLWLGRIERAGELARSAGDDAAGVGDRYLARFAGDWLGGSLLWGPLPLQAAIDHAQREESSRSSLPGILGHAIAEAMRGNFSKAREICSRNLDRAHELGLAASEYRQQCSAGTVALLEGRSDDAVRLLRSGFEGIVRSGELGYGATMAGYVGLALHEIGDDEGAAGLMDEWGPMTSSDDYEALVLQRICLSRVHARRGDANEAERLAREAVSFASGTDDIIRQGEALLALANALDVGGRVAEAAEAARGSLDRFERKGDVVEAANARLFLERLG